MDTDAFTLVGGIRVIPRTGGGVRTDDSWPLARLAVHRHTITLQSPGAGTLTITRQNLRGVRRWRYMLSRGIAFDARHSDELWIFRTRRGSAILDALHQLGWPPNRIDV
jgi:hypothetical protein